VTKFEFVATPRNVGVARARASEALTQVGVSKSDAANALLVVSELVSNAVQAAEPGSLIGLEIFRAGDQVRIAVTNVGAFALASAQLVPSSADNSRGRGLGIVQMLAQDIGIDTSAGKTTLTAWLDVTADTRR
jgi:anti-sigma regulatory factor (Ser/Thr protein kinase)